jgi:hypoxanthine phosphoribosyltransferase
LELDLDLKVLIVDDTNSTRRIIQSVLRNFGYKAFKKLQMEKKAWPNYGKGIMDESWQTGIYQR